MATPKTLSPEDRFAIEAERLSQQAAERSALRENESRNRYRQFLMDRGQDPDTIGTARINRGQNESGKTASDYYSSGLMTESDPVARRYAYDMLRREQTTAPTMSIPTIEQEYDAINTANQIAGMNNRDSIAARRLARSNPFASASILNQLSQYRSALNPSRSFEQSRASLLERLGGAYDWRAQLMNSNGFSQ